MNIEQLAKKAYYDSTPLEKEETLNQVRTLCYGENPVILLLRKVYEKEVLLVDRENDQERLELLLTH